RPFAHDAGSVLVPADAVPSPLAAEIVERRGLDVLDRAEMPKRVVEGPVLPARQLPALVRVVLHHEVEQLLHAHRAPPPPLRAGVAGLGLPGVEEAERLVHVLGARRRALGLLLTGYVPEAMDGRQLDPRAGGLRHGLGWYDSGRPAVKPSC